MSIFCLTEHIPRLYQKHLYPEELDSETTVQDLKNTFNNFYALATHLKEKYKTQLTILVGLETEGISKEYLDYVLDLKSALKFDMFVGSVHHVGDIPIDFSPELWNEACAAAGGIDGLYKRYFSDILALIQTLKPPVIGHFDLIRLFSPEYNLKSSPAWPVVIECINEAVKCNALFEINSAALRKGWDSPYPKRDLLEEILERGGKVCLSDDSHNLQQVAQNYENEATREYIKRSGQVHSVTGHTITIKEFDAWIQEQHSA